MSHIIPNAAQTYINTMPATSATPRQTMMEVMQILSAHTADVFVKVLHILSSKYGHSVDDMLDVIRTHPDYHAIHVPPVLTSEFYAAPVGTVAVDKKTRGRPKKGSGAPQAPSADNDIVPIAVPIATIAAPIATIAVPIAGAKVDNDIVPIVAPKKKIYKIKSKVPSQEQELAAVDTKEVIPHTY